MNPMTLNRMELIDELRKRTTKEQLDDAVQQSTAELRGLYARLFSSEEDRNYYPPKIPKCRCRQIGIVAVEIRPAGGTGRTRYNGPRFKLVDKHGFNADSMHRRNAYGFPSRIKKRGVIIHKV